MNFLKGNLKVVNLLTALLLAVFLRMRYTDKVGLEDHRNNLNQKANNNWDMPTYNPSEKEIKKAIKSISDLRLEIFEVNYYESQQKLNVSITITKPLEKSYLFNKLGQSVQLYLDGNPIGNKEKLNFADWTYLEKGLGSQMQVLSFSIERCPNEGAVITAVWKHLNLKNSTSETKKAKKHIFSRTNSFRP